MKRRGISFTAQTMFIICSLLLLVNVVLGSVLLSRSKMLTKTLINQRMLDIANTAADMLDGDAFETLTADSQGTPEFQAAFDTLKVFQDNINLEYIYGVRDMKDGSFIFVVDPAEVDPGEYGEPIEVTDALLTAAQGTAAVDQEPYADAWGKFYSAYSPFYDSHGQIAGIVCVDFRADWYEHQLSMNAATVLLFSVLSLLVGASLVTVLTANLRKRLRVFNTDLGELTDDVDNLLREIHVDGTGADGRNSADSADGADGADSVDGKNSAGGVHGADSAGGAGGAAGADSEAVPAYAGPLLSAFKKYPSGEAGDEMNELGRRIHSIRDALRRYIDFTHSRANSMITALASEYQSVYYIDLDSGEGVCYRTRTTIETGLREGDRFSWREAVAAYAERCVVEQDRATFLRFADEANIRRELEEAPSASHRYLTARDGQEYYEMIRVVGMRRPGDQGGGAVHAVSVGFADVDRETREAMERRHALRDALAAAEESSRAKTAFLSNMSHEIRTPMNAIIGLDSIALNDPDLPEKTREYLEKIGASARHLLGLINDILDMSRIESGRVTLKNEEFSFSKFLEQVNTMVDSQCREKGLSYECNLSGELGDYYIGDDMKLKQVIINILGNAVKFTPKGGRVTLGVACAARYQGKSTLRFTMTDTGVGMDKAFLPRLFDAFSQENASASNKYGSTGLGMAITKNIVELMNGKIEVESEKGAGTTFRVSVTLRDSARQREARSHSFQPQRLSVLVVDDDPIACEHARLVLEKAGIVSESAASGAEAVEMVRIRCARREVYDLILVDWKMPEMDGVETTRQIRAILGSETAIIILTAYNWDDVLHEAVSAGVNSFLAKPLSTASVLDEFQNVLDRRQDAADVRRADLSGRRILLAEDMEINAEIMMELLQMRELSVDHAENGRIAVELFASQPEGWYDAVLMDMRMPEMDGLEAASAIRAMDRADAKTVPIIALTANAFDEDVQRSLQAGLDAHLSKPVEPDSLFSTLESLIR